MKLGPENARIRLHSRNECDRVFRAQRSSSVPRWPYCWADEGRGQSDFEVQLWCPSSFDWLNWSVILLQAILLQSPKFRALGLLGGEEISNQRESEHTELARGCEIARFF